MTQRAVEQALGRLITDARFRREFRRDPARAAFEAGLELTAVELAALSALDLGELSELGARLDDRICRLDVSATRGTD